MPGQIVHFEIPADDTAKYPHDVRFAFKTAPQNTTRPDMLAVWKEADDIEIF